jgi:hypothetical protein
VIASRIAESANLAVIVDRRSCLLICRWDDAIVGKRSDGMVDGLKLTIRGEEIRKLLEQRIDDHQRRARWWKREQARTPAEQTEEHPLLPDHMCENEAERQSWRAEVLGFIRDHIESAEVYRLGEADLEFAELLPEKPDWLEQDEYEERTRLGFQLERLTKKVGELASSGYALLERHAEADK